MSETDEEFLDRIADYLDDYSGIPKEVRVRLFALARRGADAADEIERLRAEVQTWVNHTKTAVWSDSEECRLLAADNERLRAALREIAKTTYGYEFYMTDEETAEYFKSRFFAAQAKARTALKEDGE